jgi:hypothetical protein
MLKLDDFYDDQIILRQVKRQEAQAAAEMEEELESGDDVVIPGTQQNLRGVDDSGFRSYIEEDPEPAEEASESEEEGNPEAIDMDD